MGILQRKTPKALKPFLRPFHEKIANSKVYKNTFVNSKTKQQVHEYWRNPDADNIHTTYVNASQRSEVLVNTVQKYLKEKDSSILEIGCNVGRNLHYLYSANYHNLTGIDINQQALDDMKKFYPDLRDIQTHCSTIEDQLPKFADKKFDLVFTMAVLEHIHPDSENEVFNEIARITGKYLITIEDEVTAYSDRVFPRNYKTIFEGLGLKEIDSFNCAEMDLGKNFNLRVFSKS